MNHAIQILEAEHRVIETLLGALETYADALEEGDTADRTPLSDFAEFFRNFADRCHHGKEEDRLFVKMEAYGFPANTGPLGAMLAEHGEGRESVARLRKIGSGDGPLEEGEIREAVRTARGFAGLLSGHILKEDQILYPMAERAVPAEEMEGLAEAFETFERTVMGAGEHERYHRLADDLIRRFPPKRRGAGDHGAAVGCPLHG